MSTQDAKKKQQPSQDHANENEKDYKDLWMRATADYQNLQKEVAKQRSEWARMSEVAVIEEFLPVYDNLKSAIAHVQDPSEAMVQWKQGIAFVIKQFSDILKEHGIEEIETVGQQFDPLVHDAVSEEASDQASGIIIREVQAGYRLKETVLRPAKVIVST